VHAAGRTVEVQRVFEEPGAHRGRKVVGLKTPDLDLRMHGEGDQIACRCQDYSHRAADARGLRDRRPPADVPREVLPASSES